MNFMIKVGVDALAKSSPKTKAIIISVVAALFMFMTIIPVMAVAAPFAAAVQKFGEFRESTNNFLQTTGEKIGNLFSGRGFTVINAEKVKDQEEKVYDKLAAKYDEFSNHNVRLNFPLIAATIFYPMNFIYDEGTIANLNGMNGTSENQVIDGEANNDNNEMIYDYYKKVKENGGYIDLLANNSISVTTTTYKCEARTTTNSDGDEITYYIMGDQIETTGPQKFDGNFENKKSGTCDKGVSSIKNYTYNEDLTGYDAYLKDEHIPDNKAYKPYFEGLDDAAIANKLDTTILEIHSLSSLYADILGINQTVGRYSTFCTNGVIVSGGSSGSDQGVFSLEDYIAGVITHENNYQDPNDPNNIESIKAQAIAARTYVLVRTKNCSIPIGNSTGDQTFSKNASARAKRAANETAGMVLMYKGEMFLSEYDAYYCNEVATCISGQMCTCEYTYQPYVNSAGGKTSIDLALKHTVSIPTNAISYGGGGHGRGMSQDAANYLQSQNRYNYEQILKYFYSPGVEIIQTGDAENGMDGRVTVENGNFVIPVGMLSGLPGSEGTGPGGFNIFFWQRLSSFFDAAKAAGYKIWYTDAWRSYDAQVTCKEEKPDLCATPGKSMHGWGIAADLNFYENRAAQDWAHANAGNFNLRFSVCANYFGGVCKEPWHIEPSEIIKR